MELAEPVHFGVKMHKDTSQANGGPVHEDEFLGQTDAAQLAQTAMDLFRDISPIDTRFVVFADAPAAVFQKWAIDEIGPQIQSFNHFLV